MGIFNFFKRLNCNLKCDNETIKENGLVFVGNRMQKSKVNAPIIVEENQKAFIMCKDKLTDVFLKGNYKVNIENMPKTFSRLNYTKKNNKKKIKNVKFDFYFISEDEISIKILYKYKHNSNVKKYVEQIEINIIYKVDNLKKHMSYLFIERSYIKTGEYLKYIENALLSTIGKYMNRYKGELSDFEDEDISSGLKRKIQKEWSGYGVDVIDVIFDNYKDCSKKKHKKVKSNNIEEVTKKENVENIENTITQAELYQDTNNNEPLISQNSTNPALNNNININVNNTYKSVMESGKITINPKVNDK